MQEDAGQNTRNVQNARIETLKEKIKDLKARLPAHSVKPRMLQELEELEEELETLLEG